MYMYIYIYFTALTASWVSDEGKPYSFNIIEEDQWMLITSRKHKIINTITEIFHFDIYRSNNSHLQSKLL